jgi:hypothetical protein
MVYSSTLKMKTTCRIWGFGLYYHEGDWNWSPFQQSEQVGREVICASVVAEYFVRVI